MALIVLLSVTFFFTGRMDYFGRGSLTALIRGEQYYDSLVTRLRGHSEEEMEKLLSDESELLQSFFSRVFREEIKEKREEIWCALRARF